MLKAGDTFERYVIEALLGQGGMGAVYRAHDPKLGRRVALKVINATGSDPTTPAIGDANVRLAREARAAAALDHPNAVAIFDVGEHDAAPFIVMELVEGHTLRPSVGDASIPLPARLRQLGDVAKALAGAHHKGLVHRDIKPENVMVRPDGMVKVLDFGIARRTSRVDPEAATVSPALPTLTLDGLKVGTPVYMAPEQIRGGALDGRADQFSWGVLAYEIITGRLPWTGATDALAVMASVLTDTVDAAPLEAAGASKAVQAVVLRALSKRPEDRFASMDELLAALEAPEKGASAIGTSAQRFSTQEVKDVLAGAVERQAAKQGTSKLGFEDLLKVAAEVGVDAESLRDATRALRDRAAAAASSMVPAPMPAEARAWVRRKRRNLNRHAGVYAIVNAALLILGLVILGEWTPWWVWFLPALAWGVGLAIHALVALSAHEDDWREQQDEMKAWRESRQRRHEERMARLTGQRSPRAPAPLAGRRVEEIPRSPEPAEKLRVVATDTARERAAEEEAASAENRERGRAIRR